MRGLDGGDGGNNFRTVETYCLGSLALSGATDGSPSGDGLTGKFVWSICSFADISHLPLSAPIHAHNQTNPRMRASLALVVLAGSGSINSGSNDHLAQSKLYPSVLAERSFSLIDSGCLTPRLDLRRCRMKLLAGRVTYSKPIIQPACAETSVPLRLHRGDFAGLDLLYWGVCLR